MKLLLYLILLCFLFHECRQSVKPVENNISIESEKLFDSIPSGSGMAVKGDSIFIISDDAPALFFISLADHGYKKIPINDLPADEFRMSKNDKPDFESALMANIYGQKAVIAFGSGSKDSARDLLFILNDSGQLKVSLTKLYNYLRTKTNTALKEWNIEGAAKVGDTLILANRGNNMILNLNWNSFTQYLFAFETTLPYVSFYKISMPSIGSHEARVSGICQIDDSHALICASVEDTQDWFSDGDVLGSYISILDTKNRKLIARYALTDSAGNILKEKIESVEFLNKDADGNISLLAITDNDDGKTKLFKLKLK